MGLKGALAREELGHSLETGGLKVCRRNVQLPRAVWPQGSLPCEGPSGGSCRGQAAPAALAPARERLSSAGSERPEVLQFKYLKLYIEDDGLVLCIHPSGSCTAAHLVQGVTGTEKSLQQSLQQSLWKKTCIRS